LTLLPALLSRVGPRLVRQRRHRRPGRAVPGSSWRRWSEFVRARPWPLAIGSLAVMVALLVPAFALRLDASDAGNDQSNLSSRHAYDMLAQGFGPGFNGPLTLVATLPQHGEAQALAAVRAAAARTPGVRAVATPVISPSGEVAVIQVYPISGPQSQAT